MPKRKRPSCSDEAWRMLWTSANKTIDQVFVEREALEELVLCHRAFGDVPQIRTYTSRGKYIQVQRMDLFTCLRTHGKVCEKTDV